MFTGVFREQENCGLKLCFPCVNRQRRQWENVRKTRHSPDRENERKRCRKQRIHCGFSSAGKHSMNFTFCRRSQKENAEFTGRFPKSRKRIANHKFSNNFPVGKITGERGFSCRISLGLRSRMRSISKIKQWNLFWYFLRILNFFRSWGRVRTNFTVWFSKCSSFVTANPN